MRWQLFVGLAIASGGALMLGGIGGCFSELETYPGSGGADGFGGGGNATAGGPSCDAQGGSTCTENEQCSVTDCQIPLWVHGVCTPGARDLGYPCKRGDKDGACDGDGQCKPAPGQTCANNEGCFNKQCVDGVCCNMECGGLCRSCNWGKPGECILVPGGAQDDTCKDGYACHGSDGNATCEDLDSHESLGKPCNEPNVYCNSPLTCNDGFCNLENGAACNPEKAWLCATNHCKDYKCSKCDANSPCAGGTCFSGVCTMPLGQPCNDPSICESGFCVDGVCCNSQCSTMCQACSADKKQSGTEGGTCGPSKAGVSDGLCTKCDSAGNCQP